MVASSPDATTRSAAASAIVLAGAVAARPVDGGDAGAELGIALGDRLREQAGKDAVAAPRLEQRGRADGERQRGGNRGQTGQVAGQHVEDERAGRAASPTSSASKLGERRRAQRLEHGRQGVADHRGREAGGVRAAAPRRGRTTASRVRASASTTSPSDGRRTSVAWSARASASAGRAPQRGDRRREIAPVVAASRASAGRCLTSPASTRALSRRRSRRVPLRGGERAAARFGAGGAADELEAVALVDSRRPPSAPPWRCRRWRGRRGRAGRARRAPPAPGFPGRAPRVRVQCGPSLRRGRWRPCTRSAMTLS